MLSLLPLASFMASSSEIVDSLPEETPHQSERFPVPKREVGKRNNLSREAGFVLGPGCTTAKLGTVFFATFAAKL